MPADGKWDLTQYCIFSGMGAATIFGAKQVQVIYTIFDFFSFYYIL
jgi:hypothetical protein